MTNGQPRQMRKYFVEMALEPIKAMVNAGAIPEDQALSMVVETTRCLERDPTAELDKFVKNSGKLFENEAKFQASYKSFADHYNYQPSSRNDQTLLYKLYQHMKGRRYDSPDKLKKEMQRLLENKRILELGCGPGFCVKTLEDLGAKVTGIEIREDHRGKIPGLDIRYGNVLNLDSICKQDNFDLVVSNDFFAVACIHGEEAEKAVEQISRKTLPGGLNIHLMAYMKMSPAVHEFRAWLVDRRNGNTRMQDMLNNLTDEEYESSLWTNRSSLDPQDLIRNGMSVLEYAIDNGDLVIAARKTGESQ